MGGYTRTGPFTNGSAPGISATFLNNVEAVLARPATDTETGKYYMISGYYTTGVTNGIYMPSLSRTSTPSSVTIDQADQGHTTNIGNPATNGLTSSGFRIQCVSTAASTAEFVGGNYTIHY